MNDSPLLSHCMIDFNGSVYFFFISCIRICVCVCFHFSRHRERPLVDVFDMARLRLQAPVRRPSSRNVEPRNLLRIHDSLQLKYTGINTCLTLFSCALQINITSSDLFECQMEGPDLASARFLSWRKWVCPAEGGGTTESRITSPAARDSQSRTVRAHLKSNIYNIDDFCFCMAVCKCKFISVCKSISGQ